MTVQESPLSTDTFVTEWEEWHRHKDAALAHEHGFLAVTGLYWPSSEPQRFPGTPGVWSAGDDGVTVELDDGRSWSSTAPPCAAGTASASSRSAPPCTPSGATR